MSKAAVPFNVDSLVIFFPGRGGSSSKSLNEGHGPASSSGSYHCSVHWLFSLSVFLDVTQDRCLLRDVWVSWYKQEPARSTLTKIIWQTQEPEASHSCVITITGTYTSNINAHHQLFGLTVCLCLQLEVSQLEGSLQQPKAQSSMSPYLVPDTAALCQHLNIIRQLAGSGCFIIIIPRTGQCTALSPVWLTKCTHMLSRAVKLNSSTEKVSHMTPNVKRIDMKS